MRVLGRDGRFLDRMAMRRGDILLRLGNMVQDESADAASIRGPVAQVEAEQHLLVLHVTPDHVARVGGARHFAPSILE